MTKEEMWLHLQAGLRFTTPSPGDWEFCIREVDGDWRFIAKKVR